MKEKILIALLFLCSMSITGQTTDKMTYQKQWEAVASFEKESLPQSARKEVDGILRLALKEKNSAQIIKALIHQSKYDMSIDSENSEQIFSSLHEMIDKSTDNVEKALVHSLLAELYKEYADIRNSRRFRNFGTPDNRTSLGDVVPDDMKEWTRNIFQQKVAEHLYLSLQDQSILEQTSVDAYKPILIEGKDNERYFPTMYDFLSRRAVEISRGIFSDLDKENWMADKGLHISDLLADQQTYVQLNINPNPNPNQEPTAMLVYDIYAKWMKSLMNRKMNESALLVELDKYDDLGAFHDTRERLGRQYLDSLLAKWKNNPLSVEIADKIVPFYEADISDSKKNTTEQVAKQKALYDFLNGYITAFPTYERISILQNRLSNLTNPLCEMSISEVLPSGNEIKASLTYRNITSLRLKLYRIESATDFYLMEESRSQADKMTFVKDIDVPLSALPPYERRSQDVVLGQLPLGFYIAQIEAQPKSESNASRNKNLFFTISDLAVFSTKTISDVAEIFVVDRSSGKPLANAQVNMFTLNKDEFTLVKSFTTNNQGLATIPIDLQKNIRQFFFSVQKGDDRYGNITRAYIYRNNYMPSSENSLKIMSLFTDRSVYRPGQTVYIKGIYAEPSRKEAQPIAKNEVSVVLKDANYEVVSEKSFTTNEFGSFAGEFTLPMGVLPGTFRIEHADGSVSIDVAEYKRPTFDITFEAPNGTFQFGDTIQLSGEAKNFSGVPLQDVSVSYTITRAKRLWRMWQNEYSQFDQNVVKTDKDGRFVVSFVPTKSITDGSEKAIYMFTVNASVTDINGETQEKTYTISVGDISLQLNVDMPNRIDKQGDVVPEIEAMNLMDVPVQVIGQYDVLALNDDMVVGKQVLTGNFKAGKLPELMKKLQKIESGRYRIVFNAKDEQNRDVSEKHDFILYSKTDKRPPIDTSLWVVSEGIEFDKNTVPTIVLGSSKHVYALVEVWQSDKLISREWIELNNQNRTLTYPQKNNTDTNLTWLVSLVKENDYHYDIIEFKPKLKDNKLTVKLDVFRDKLRSGESEEWTVRVLGEDNKPVDAELLASMYDVSLDKINAYMPWRLSLPSWRGLGARNEFSFYGFEKNSANQQFPRNYMTVKDLIYNRMNWFDFSFANSFLVTNTALRSATYRGRVLGAAAPSAKFKDSADMFAEENVEAIPETDSMSDNQPIDVREDFAETAFFYPMLRTNEKGETLIAFKVPESLTKWRFRVLAHNKQMAVGNAEAFTITQKELMVIPNIPRFMRHGDATTISTKISNLSENAISGQVSIELFNPVTDALYSELSAPLTDVAFNLSPSGSSDASWTFTVPSNMDMIGVRIVARGGNFSDGEQHAIAVLPNRMLVTESMTMNVDPQQQNKTFVFDKLADQSSPTRTNYRLTAEFTSNPAWYAVQALPTLSQPVNENAVSWFVALYANQVAGHIMSHYPQVSDIIKAWQAKRGDSQTLLSQLEKNEELKQVVLAETPWVLEAKDETEQKQSLALLLDLNRSQNMQKQALKKLAEYQQPDGGWAWIDGFNSWVSISQYILLGFSQLNELNALPTASDVNEMINSGIAFIDNKAIERFEILKKNNKDWQKRTSVSLQDLEYLYVRSFYPNVQLPQEANALSEFYLGIIQDNWTRYSYYQRALIAQLLYNKGNKTVADKILASYREHATQSDELGMYWANNRESVFFSQSAVITHLFIMKAFKRGGSSEQELNAMKRWLLKQKQTQQWESTHATIEAVYTLLSSGRDWFSVADNTSVKVGNTLLDTSDAEVGTGYIKESWEKEAITPQMAQVEVSHHGNMPAWGAIYWQYYEDLDKIEKTDSPLDVEKQLFVERTDNNGTKLMSITADSPLRVGDKVVVRLTIRSDRDYEFVHLKDMRAACFEPIEQLSGIKWQDGRIFYQATKDASTNFYFDRLPRGTIVIEYPVYVSRMGTYSNGISTIQCMYAPEFTSHTKGITIDVH